MTLTCSAPDVTTGVAIRFATYADCQARALGENGFQALIGSPIATGLISGLVTIFVALVGYRLILGQALTLGDGVNRVVRLGMVLTLTTAWPAFQVLVFNVAANGPTELAAVLLPSTGLPDQGTAERVQLAYDTMRLGVVEVGRPAPETTPAGPPNREAAAASADQRPSTLASFGLLPQTASIFVISTLGVNGALRIAIGFLLAIAPLALVGLLFDATLGLFAGWVRALAGAALALLASAIVTAIELVMIEGELGAQQEYSRGLVTATVDPQGLTTLAMVFAIVMLVVVIIAFRMAGAFVLRWGASFASSERGSLLPAASSEQGSSGRSMIVNRRHLIEGRSRATALADELRSAAARDATMSTTTVDRAVGQGPQRHVLVADGMVQSARHTGLSRSGRRSGLGRPSRSGATRDRTS